MRTAPEMLEKLDRDLEVIIETFTPENRKKAIMRYIVEMAKIISSSDDEEFEKDESFPYKYRQYWKQVLLELKKQEHVVVAK